MANEGFITLNDLRTKFKAAGVFTVYRDGTASANQTSSSPMRLVFGFSRFGLFNTCVYIEKGDISTATKLFGPIDTVLEGKQSFFHRSIFTMLEEGPVLAINLLKLNNSVDSNGVPTVNADMTPYRSFSVDVAAANGVKTQKMFASYYNKERFWKPDRAYLLATRSQSDKGSLLNLTNLSQTPISFIIRKSQVKGYDITVKKWYDSVGGGIPPYLKANDYISDYFVDVIAIYGDFGPAKYASLATDPIYGQYFTANGMIISQLNAFLQRSEIKLVDVFTGSLIPNFKDSFGVSQFIETIINQKTSTTGILCAIDKKEFDNFTDETNTHNLDLVGHGLIGGSVQTCDFLSYKKKIVQDYSYAQKTTNNKIYFASASNFSVVQAPQKLIATIGSAHPLFGWASKIKLGDYFQGQTTSAGTNFGISITNPVLEVTSVVTSNTNVIIELSSPLKDGETSTSGSFINLKSTNAVTETKATGTITLTVAGNAGDIITAIVNNGLVDVTIGSYTVATGNSTSVIATALVAAIDAGTSTHGFTAAASGAVVTVTAPTGSFTLPNLFYKLKTTLVGTVADTLTQFSGGLGNPTGYQWEMDLTRMYIDGTNSFYLADKKTPIFASNQNGDLTDGDKLTDGTHIYYLKFTQIRDVTDFGLMVKITLFTDQALTVPVSTGNAIAFGASIDSNGFVVATNINFISMIGSINERFVTSMTVAKNVVRVDISQEPNIVLGNYLVAVDIDGNPILSLITSIKRIKNNNGVPTDIEITTLDEIKLFPVVGGGYQVERYQPIEAFFDTYNMTVLDGFKLKATHMPNGTNERMKDILSVMLETNIYNSLIDPEMVDFRYLVDTFNHGLETQSKRGLARLVRDRSKCLGLLNAPSVEEFKNSQDPLFTETPTASDPLPILNVQYIADGANLSQNPSFLYTLPEEEDGASYVGTFIPNITKREDSGDYLSIPPAALVSNNFMKKYNGGNPFKPTAGLKRGVLTGDGLVGVEYDFDQNQRGILQQKGLNPIYQKKTGEIVIMGDETNYKQMSSVLNNLSVRDLLVTIEIEHTKILEPYVFDYNNDATETEVKQLLGDFLGSIKNGYGALASFSLIFDTNNNPDWVLRENAAICDVIVEPASVAQKFIQRITLIKGSSPTVGAFVAV